MSQERWALHRISELAGLGVRATDGDIGSVTEAYFDDEKWAIRYLVVDTGRWLPGREVLISPISVRTMDWSERWLALLLSRQQVERSPEVDTDKPVSHQHEVDFYEYYGMSPYWGGPGLWGPFPTPGDLLTSHSIGAASPDKDAGDPHLRSAREVLSYHLQADDQVIGHVEDFLFDDVTWEVSYMVVDSGTWWSNKKVLLSPRWIAGVSWADRKVYLRLSPQTIRHAPDWDPNEPISQEYERRLRGYYGERLPLR